MFHSRLKPLDGLLIFCKKQNARNFRNFRFLRRFGVFRRKTLSEDVSEISIIQIIDNHNSDDILSDRSGF